MEFVNTGIIVFAHGSSVEPANDAVRAVTAQVARAGGYSLIDTAFLEMAKPDLAEAVDRMVHEGASRVVVIPYFLTLGVHLKRDLPLLVEDIGRRYGGVNIEVTDPLDGHPALPRIVLERVQKALECCPIKSHTPRS